MGPHLNKKIFMSSFKKIITNRALRLFPDHRLSDRQFPDSTLIPNITQRQACSLTYIEIYAISQKIRLLLLISRNKCRHLCYSRGSCLQSGKLNMFAEGPVREPTVGQATIGEKTQCLTNPMAGQDIIPQKITLVLQVQPWWLGGRVPAS